MAPRGATGTCRDRPAGERGPRWVRPWTRVEYALDASTRLIHSTLRAAVAAKRCAQRRPIRSSRKLGEALAWLVTASSRLERAAQQLAETNACIALEPERSDGAPECLISSTRHWTYVAEWLTRAVDEVFALHQEVLRGLETGTLVPERTTPRRRIILTPRPAPVRAFLRTRQPRVTDRIAPLLRRRRTRRPPAVPNALRRICRGRAPPPASIAQL